MTKKYKTPEELPRPSLTLPKAEAQAKIEDRIKVGKDLLGRSITSQNELEEAESEGKRWQDFNKELLGVIFDNDKFAQEYENNSYPGIYSMGETSIYEDIQEFKENIKRRLNALASIKDRLELMSEFVEVKDGTPLDKNTSSKSRGSYTLNISGGTVMLGDGNKVNNLSVGDIITEIENEISKLPDSKEKKEALSGLKILKNETFASVTGAAVGSFLSSWLR